jgi:hypothetical protein
MTTKPSTVLDGGETVVGIVVTLVVVLYVAPPADTVYAPLLPEDPTTVNAVPGKYQLDTLPDTATLLPCLSTIWCEVVDVTVAVYTVSSFGMPVDTAVLLIAWSTSTT